MFLMYFPWVVHVLIGYLVRVVGEARWLLPSIKHTLHNCKVLHFFWFPRANSTTFSSISSPPGRGGYRLGSLRLDSLWLVKIPS
jgi:hypothetical protein